MDINKQLRQLDNDRREKIKSINDEWRKKKEEIYSNCLHEYGDWKVNTHGSIPDTNFRGEYFERRKCKFCGHEESRIKE